MIEKLISKGAIIQAYDPIGSLKHIFKRNYKTGKVFRVFVFGYAVIRFLIEFTREPDSQIGYLIFNLSMGQYLSLLMILFGVWWFNYEKNK